MNEAAAELRAETSPVKFTEKNLRNFWRKVDKNGPLPDQSNPHYAGLDRCWAWTGAKLRKGYGQWGVNGKLFHSHRASWMMEFGEIPKHQHVLHRCDVSGCVNPSHLFLGSELDNARDREAKGRGKQPSGDRSGKRLHPESNARGEKNFKAKVTAEIVREIREKYACGGYSHQSLADFYGIDKSQAGRIIRRQFWKHVI